MLVSLSNEDIEVNYEPFPANLHDIDMSRMNKKA